MLGLQILVAIVIIWQSWVFYNAVAKLGRSLLVQVLTFGVMEISLLAVIALGGAVTLLVLTLLAYLPGRNKNILTDQSITLTDGGILVETQNNRFESDWAAVQRASQSKSDIYIFLSQNGGHVIPKRAFSSRGEADAFYAYILSHWKPAVGKAPG